MVERDSTMRVLVCGSRLYPNRAKVYALLLSMKQDIQSILSGAAKGPDTWAIEFAREHGIAVELYPAKWFEHGKRAGYIRNEQMINTKPDLVIAFWDDLSKGTKHTIDLAEKHGIECRVITP